MENKPDKLNQIILERLRIFLSTSLGIFLFILFFQPFALDRLDYNNRLLYVIGFGGITFLLSLIVLLIFFLVIRFDYQKSTNRVGISYLMGFIIMALNSVAFTFYIRYVGLVSITFYIVFKVVLISLIPIVVLRLYEIFKELKQHNDLLVQEKRRLQKQVDTFEDENLNKTIEFVSENSTENIILLISEVVLLKSADNYVEVYFNEGSNNLKKKLVRNTLKNIELQLNQYSNFIRCHRICIVNKYYIENLNKGYNSHWLDIKGYTEQIPVSRQYLLKVKESI